MSVRDDQQRGRHVLFQALGMNIGVSPQTPSACYGKGCLEDGQPAHGPWGMGGGR